jgi:hypothetical protein
LRDGCVRCPTPTGGPYLCRSCSTALRVELADVAGIIPDHHNQGGLLLSLPDELHVTFTGQDQLTDPGEPITGKGEIPLVFKGHAGEALWILHQVLQEWATTLHHDDPQEGPRDLALWMLHHLHLIQKHPDAGQLVDEVTDAIHQARSAIDRPTDDRIYLGRCGSEQRHTHGYPTSGPPCTEELYGYPWLSRTICPHCGTEYDITQRQDLLRARKNRYQGTVSQIAGFLRATGVQCTTEQVRGFARSRDGRPPRLEPSGTNDLGYSTYLITDVVKALKTRYQRRTRE